LKRKNNIEHSCSSSPLPPKHHPETTGREGGSERRESMELSLFSKQREEPIPLNDDVQLHREKKKRKEERAKKREELFQEGR